MKAIVTVLGKDKVGIIADVAITMKEHDVNICDISQTLMQDYFTMIMLVDISASKLNMAGLQDVFNAKGKELGMEIRLQSQDLFQKMYNI